MEHRVARLIRVPNETARRELVARRMNFAGAGALAQFDEALNTHTANVRTQLSNRVFADRSDELAAASGSASSFDRRFVPATQKLRQSDSLPAYSLNISRNPLQLLRQRLPKSSAPKRTVLLIPAGHCL